MAKPNYQFEKRRKEVDKKAKKAEKLRLKAEAARTPAGESAAPTPSEQTCRGKGCSPHRRPAVQVDLEFPAAVVRAHLFGAWTIPSVVFW